jgi:hypothetical protein
VKNKARLNYIAKKLVALETLEGKELEAIFTQPMSAKPRAKQVVKPATAPAKAKAEAKKSRPKKSPAIGRQPKQSPAAS